MGHAYSAATGHAQATPQVSARGSRPDPLQAGVRRGHFEVCAGSGRTGQSRCWSSRSGRTRYQAALDDFRARPRLCVLLHPRRCRQARPRPGDAATSYPGTCRRLPDDPERRATTPHCWRLNWQMRAERVAWSGWRPMAGASEDRRPRSATPSSPGKCAGSYHLSCVVDDSGERRDDGRARCRLARFDAGATPVGTAAGTARADLCHHALVTHLDGRRLAKRDLAHSRRHARSGRRRTRVGRQLLAGHLPSGFRPSRAKKLRITPLLLILLLAMAATAYVLVRA